MKNNPLDIDEFYPLYQKNFDALFALTFVHTGSIKAATILLNKIFLSLTASSRKLNSAKENSWAALQLGEQFCQHYYQEKLRKKIKKEKFESLTYPFETQHLLEVIRLSPSLKSTLVLHSLGYSDENIAEILHCSISKTESRLSRLKQLPVYTAENKKAIAQIKLPDKDKQALFDAITLAITEKGFSFSQFLKNSKRWLDNHIFFISLFLLLIFIIAYLGVHYQWF